MTPRLQLACDGAWEDALVLALPAPNLEVEALIDRLAARGSAELAAEVLWCGPPLTFVGARFAAGERERFGERVWAACVTASAGAPAPAVLVALAGEAPGRPYRAELGAVNAWRSIGPLEVPLDATAADVRRLLAERPDLGRATRPVALELVCAVPGRSHDAWWAVAVSRPEGGRHVVDAAAVAAALSDRRAR